MPRCSGHRAGAERPHQCDCADNRDGAENRPVHDRREKAYPEPRARHVHDRVGGRAFGRGFHRGRVRDGAGAVEQPANAVRPHPAPRVKRVDRSRPSRSIPPAPAPRGSPRPPARTTFRPPNTTTYWSVPPAHAARSGLAARRRPAAVPLSCRLAGPESCLLLMRVVRWTCPGCRVLPRGGRAMPIGRRSCRV